MSSSDDKTIPVTVSVSGRSYRLVTTARQDEVQRLVEVVECRMPGPSRGRTAADALLLAALSLAHDVEEQRGELQRLRSLVRGRLQALVEKVDLALAMSPMDSRGVEGTPGIGAEGDVE